MIRAQSWKPTNQPQVQRNPLDNEQNKGQLVAAARTFASRAPLAPLLAAILGSLATSAALAQGASSVPRLAPVGAPVEVVDTSERISGNATTGIAFVQPSDKIGYDRLWAYLSDPVPAKLKLKISSIDGRYYAEVEYATGNGQPGWIALDLSLREFKFLEDNYKDPLSEIAALLSDSDGPRFYPVRWASSHGGASAPPDAPKDTDPLRVYMNTERAQAFVVVNNSPVYCRDASAMSGFKFNAICDMTLADVRNAKLDGDRRVVEAIEVFRRSGVRTLAPVTVEVQIKY
jgi:hypothetical protein